MIPNKTMRGGVRYIKNDFRYSFLTVRLLKGLFLGEQRESGIRRAISRFLTEATKPRLSVKKLSQIKSTRMQPKVSDLLFLFIFSSLYVRKLIYSFYLYHVFNSYFCIRYWYQYKKVIQFAYGRSMCKHEKIKKIGSVIPSLPYI